MIRFILLLLTTTAFAQLKDVDSQALAFKNILKNGGFENGKTGWTSTGSANLSSSQAYPAFGKMNGYFDFSAAGEFIRTPLTAIPSGLYGKNCLARFKYIGGGTSDIYYRVTDGTNTLAGYTSTSTSFKISTAATVHQDSLDMTFPCPTSGSLRVEFEAAGNAAVLYVDDVYIGENFKVGTVAQATLVGTIKISGCAGGWTSTSGSYADYSVNTSCTYSTTGNVSNPSTMLPGFNLAGAPGKYWIIATGMPAYTSGSTSVCAFRMTDGTDSSLEDNVGSSSADSLSANLNFSIEKTTAFSTQFRIQTKRQTGSGTCATYGAGSADYPLTFKVYRFPLTSETAVSANVPYQGGKMNMVGVTSCSWSTTSGTYAAFANDTDCNSATFTGGASAATNAKTPAMKFASLEAGDYLAIATGSIIASASTDCYFQVYDGTNAVGSVQLSSATGATSRTSTIAGIFSYTSKQSNIQYDVRAAQTSGSGGCVLSNATANDVFQFSLIPLSPSISMPNLVNSVRTSSTGVEKIVRLKFSGGTFWTDNCAASPCTINGQSGSDVTSVTRSAAGQYTVNFASGTWSSANAFSCTCTSLARTTFFTSCGQNDTAAPTTTTWNLMSRNHSLNAGSDSSVEVVCVGAQP